MHISEINIYPVKSLKGISVQASLVEPKGLELDRRWIIVDVSGKFLTQRELPRMATINVARFGNGIVVTAAGRGQLRVDPIATGERVSTEVWGRPGDAFPYDAETNQWLSQVLGTEVELRYMPDDAARPVRPPFDNNGSVTGFADGYPLLLIGEASLTDLNGRIDENGDDGVRAEVPMNRFRPNIVVAGADPFSEDSWSRIRVGEAVFRSTKPCDRCIMTTVDQAKGEFAGKEPLRTLATYRKASQVIPDRYESYILPANSVLFGQNLIPETPGVTIQVGDAVEVIERY
ncbi:MAG TPA: MOSC N-terminal beta barrel domain-containing protein [Pyrinomonadaceae bacterium]|nr:MOSC N-terminal beta barrel domain-containing protein [Pyrinomonadaceae bacterium]